MSGIIKREGNRLDATYDQPWGGVASDVDASDLQPSQFVVGDGLYIKNGRVCTAQWANSTALVFWNVVAAEPWFQAERVQWVFAMVEGANSDNPHRIIVALCGITGNAYIGSPIGGFAIDKTLAGFTISPNFDCYQIIAGVVYIFDWLAGMEYVYTPGVSFVIGNTFVGGKYCAVLTGYLLTADTNQPTDSPNIKPNRYNWSAPYAYTTWDPAIDRTSGFNTLSSVSDTITGIFTMGNVGYILRTQGITQLSPTGVGISPFSATDLWDSQFGIGCTYPDTFDQYGALAIWANNNNIYAFFSGSMPQAIAGHVQEAIYEDLNRYENDTTVYTFVSGAISNTSEYAKNPELTYTLTIVYFGPNSGGIMSSAIWTYVLETKAWTRQTPDFDAQIKAITGDSSPINSLYSVNTMGVFQYGVNYFNTYPPFGRIRSNILISIVRSGVAQSFLFSLYYNDSGISSQCPIAMPFNATFRQEEIRLGIKPTVRGILVKAAGTGTLAMTVNNTPFTPIVLDGTAKAKTYKSYGELTEENPQLKITSTNADAAIVKVNMNMTYEEGSPL